MSAIELHDGSLSGTQSTFSSGPFSSAMWNTPTTTPSLIPGRKTTVVAHHHDGHHHHGAGAETAIRPLSVALALIVAFMAVEVALGVLAHSLALLSDAAHMLVDAAALAMSVWAARLALRPAGGRMTF